MYFYFIFILYLHSKNHRRKKEEYIQGLNLEPLTLFESPSTAQTMAYTVVWAFMWVLVVDNINHPKLMFASEMGWWF